MSPGKERVMKKMANSGGGGWRQYFKRKWIAKNQENL